MKLIKFPCLDISKQDLKYCFSLFSFDFEEESGKMVVGIEGRTFAGLSLFKITNN